MIEKPATDNAALVRHSLEEVCSGRNLDALEQCYSPHFVDHVNSLEYHGHDGVRESVALYQAIFRDLRFEVNFQVAERLHVATRWTLHGTNRGRRVALPGITISRLDHGRIAEDWGLVDSLELVRQLGLWRSLLVGLRHRKLLRRPRQPGSE